MAVCRRRRAALPVPELGFGNLRSAGFDLISILGRLAFGDGGFQGKSYTPLQSGDLLYTDLVGADEVWHTPTRRLCSGPRPR
jgi:hypothetical protein